MRIPTVMNSRRYIRLLIFSGVFASAIFTGTKVFANPLMTYAEFYDSISAGLDGEYNLGANIDVTSITDGNTVFEGIFTGVLNGLKADGANYIIFGLTRPLFDRIGDGAEIKNLQLETDSVNGVTGNGVLANTLEAGATVNNVDVTGNVSGGTEVGGLVGNSSGTITNSTVVGNVTGTGYVGGLVGKSVGDISDSSATGDVTGQNADGYLTDYIGGLVGESVGNITGSSASGYRSGNNYVGGLVGKSVGDIRDSSATGDLDFPEEEAIPEFVLGSEYVGGLVGYSEGDVINSNAAVGVGGLHGDYTGGLVGKSVGDIRDSSASGVVFNGSMGGPGDYTGGLVGYTTGDVTNSDASGDVEGGSYVGGLVGYSERNIEDSHATGDVISLTSFEFDFDYEGFNGDYGERNSGDYLGGLVGYTEGDIADSYATGDVSSTVEVSIANAPSEFSIQVYSGDNLGGLVGYTEGIITLSSAEGVVSSLAILNILSMEDPDADVLANIEIESGEQLGGLAGYSAAGAIGSHALGDVIATATLTFGDISPLLISDWEYYAQNNFGGDWVGGLVGESDGNITNSYATGNVAGDYKLGGLVGYTTGDVTNSYATGNVTGDHKLGGLVGDADNGSEISNSYATGDVTGYDKLGGLAGELSDDGIIIDSYATGNVTGSYNLGGLVGQLFEFATVTDSYATGDVTGDLYLGGLVGYAYNGSEISNSYAAGNVTGDDNLGGLVGELVENAIIRNSYAIGDVTAAGTGSSGDAGGLVGYSAGDITHSHASGDVSGEYDTGGLVGDLEDAGSITNSYATGNVRATGSDGDWNNGWGGLVGESGGLISNSYATGNVVADYNYGSLIGFAMLNEAPELQVINSFATGQTSSANNVVHIFEYVYDEDGNLLEENELQLDGLGGPLGCAVLYGFESYSCIDFDEILPIVTPSILSVVNTVAGEEEPAFEIVACKNNGLPSLSELIDSYENTCASPSSSNRERRIREFIQPTSVTEIAKALGFVLSPTFPNDAQIGFVKNEKELAISKVLGVQKVADRVARTFVKTGEALQISYDFDGKDPIELWVKLPDGKWILAGVIRFDENGKAILPPIQFKVAGEYVVALNKLSEDSEKASAPLNQIGYLTVIVTNGDSV